MDLRKLNEEVAVAGQITADDVADLAKAGYRSIVCNRPDGEAADQPGVETIKAAATQAGLEFAYVPIFPQTGITQEAVAQFSDALATLPKPMLAYCRSGARSTNLFNASSTTA